MSDRMICTGTFIPIKIHVSWTLHPIHYRYSYFCLSPGPYYILTNLPNQHQGPNTQSHLRSINLLDLRQSKDDLSPITRPIICLTGITLQVDRLEFRQDRKLRIESSEVCNLISARLVVSQCLSHCRERGEGRGRTQNSWSSERCEIFSISSISLFPISRVVSLSFIGSAMFLYLYYSRDWRCAPILRSSWDRYVRDRSLPDWLILLVLQAWWFDWTARRGSSGQRMTLGSVHKPRSLLKMQ
jgi:hypothetical protein